MNEWVEEIRRLRKKVKEQQADLLIGIAKLEAMTTERDNWKKKYEDIEATSDIFGMFSGKKN